MTCGGRAVTTQVCSSKRANKNIRRNTQMETNKDSLIQIRNQIRWQRWLKMSVLTDGRQVAHMCVSWYCAEEDVTPN